MRIKDVRAGGCAVLLGTLLASSACLRMGFDERAVLPPVAFEPGRAKISVLHEDAAPIRGTCTAIGGTISLSGDGEGSALCTGGGAWEAAVDFSAAPDGLVTVVAIQRTADGELSSPPVERQFEKDTDVCRAATAIAAMPFAGGAGTEAEPFVVCTAAQLESTRANLGAHIRLGNDIDVGETPWSSFGKLTGVFDGNGFVIENLSYQTSSWPSGLFAEATGRIENLGVVDVNIWSYCHVGAVVGILHAGGEVRRCFASGVIQSYSDAVGGLVGENTGTIVDSFSSVEVTDTGSFCVGGLVGVTDSGGSVSRSYATGRVTAFGADRVGGLVGCNDGELTNAYALGAAAGNAATTKIGGLVGENAGTIRWAFSAGAVLGLSPGGLVGAGTGEVTAAFWDREQSGLADSAGGTALTRAAMQQRASFAGWDFAQTWTFDPVRPGYPILVWQ